ncbi:MAG: hypothetical protein LQ350_008078 [Teloschistes chrysophthalmus]|nr:MAG: hypothetical protein LQ350_008078 [Niorma chrysophthalma]
MKDEGSKSWKRDIEVFGKTFVGFRTAVLCSAPQDRLDNRTNEARSSSTDGMSDTGSDISEADPPWGSLASESYLLHHWDAQSSETPSQQRKRLVQEFIQAGPERSVQPVTPSPTEISTILSSWRTSAQREVADTSSTDPAVWLRTCYAEGSDAKHEELVGTVEMDNAVGGDHRLLNDAALYNFGSEWQQIFSILPELLEPADKDWTYHLDKQRSALQELTAYAQAGLASVDQRLMDNLTGVAQGTPEIGFRGQQLEDAVAAALQSNVHRAHVVTWIVLEDEEALASGNVAVLFLDARGRVVRSKRVEPAYAEGIGGLWQDGSWDEISDWQDGEVGDEYRSGGACDHLLLDTIRSNRS